MWYEQEGMEHMFGLYDRYRLLGTNAHEMFPFNHDFHSESLALRDAEAKKKAKAQSGWSKGSKRGAPPWLNQKKEQKR